MDPSRRHVRRTAVTIGDGVGLANLGNTCFMNSVLQCLAHTKPFLDYCLKESYLPEINRSTISSMKGTLIIAFAQLVQAMWRKEPEGSSISPHALKMEIQRFAPRFMGYSQQDSQEFLRYLLQGMHDDINRVTHRPRGSASDQDAHLTEIQKANESWKKYLKLEDSKIVDLFVGQLKSNLRCTYCNNDSVTFDPFWDLSLPIPKGVSSGRVSLEQCLHLFTQEEILDGDERPKCSKCKVKRKCAKGFSIHKFPQILVLHLKRFSAGDRYRAKVTTKVDFPLVNLDLSPFCSATSRDRWTTYNLYAVSNHAGSLSSGHYTAYCKHPSTGIWQVFNDSRVSRIRAQDVVTSEAYILFYEMASQPSRL